MKQPSLEEIAYLQIFKTKPPYFPTREIEKIKILTQDGIVQTFLGAGELCVAHDIKQKNMWRKMAHQKGIEVMSVKTVTITNNLDRKKMIKRLRMFHGQKNHKLVYLKDDELYELWKKLKFNN
jgi:hypothetical protein